MLMTCRQARSFYWRRAKQAIAYLSKHEGIHQAALADLLEIEPITLVRILDKLEDRGLIERRQHQTDRRIWLLFLKDVALLLLADMYDRRGDAG